MLEFETVCYLENQKTGSTFVEAFLRQHLDEPLLRYAKHKPARIRKAGKFYFTNVRDPLDLYMSLFNYGLDGYGRVLERAKIVGRHDFYAEGIAGFDRWLAFVLSPAFAPVLPKYQPRAGEFGLATWRLKRLTHFNFRREAPAIDAVLRYEALRADLKAVAEAHLSHALRDPAAALAWIEDYRPVNASTRRDRGAPPALSPATLATLIDRDRYVYETHYPEALARIEAALAAAEAGPIPLNALKAA